MMSGADPVPDEDTMWATLMSAAPMMLLYIPLDMRGGYTHVGWVGGASTSTTPSFSRTSKCGNGFGAIGRAWVMTIPAGENDVEWHGQRSRSTLWSNHSLQPWWVHTPDTASTRPLTRW